MLKKLSALIDKPPVSKENYNEFKKILSNPLITTEALENITIENQSLISAAVRLENYILTSLLLEKGLNPSTPNSTGETPLHFAALIGNDALVALLLKHQANIEAATSIGWTPLYYAVCQHSHKTVELLLNHGANAKNNGERKRTLLHVFAISPKPCSGPEIIDLLLAKGLDINARDEAQKTPLQYAWEYNNYDVVLMLLKRGANFANMKNSEGETLLHFACASGRIDLLNFLLKQKKTGYQPRKQQGTNPLHLAAQKNNTFMVKILLEEAGANPNMPPNHVTPLHTAIHLGNIDVVRLLIKHNANTEAEDHDGQPPLLYAIHAPLLDFSADIVNGVNNGKKLRDQRIEIVRILLEEGKIDRIKSAKIKYPL